jgi:hypothetical protein
VRAAILHSLQNLVSFPRVGKAQTVEGVRKLVIRRYSYLVYYTVDEIAEEIVVLTIQHPARERESTRMPSFQGVNSFGAPEAMASTSALVGIEGAAPIRCTEIEAAALA